MDKIVEYTNNLILLMNKIERKNEMEHLDFAYRALPDALLACWGELDE